MIHKRFLRSWAPALALAALLLPSCSKDDPGGTGPDGTTAGGGDIRFEIGFAPQTRAATGTDFKATWEDGDEIGIFAVVSGTSLSSTSANNYINNVKLTYDKASDIWTSATPLYWPNTGSGITALDFYAYHPYDVSAINPTAIAFTVQADQNGATDLGGGTVKSNYNLSDLLTAKSDNSGSGYGRGETIPLTFSHALAMVQVMLTDDRANNVGAVGDIEISLRGVKTASTLNLGGQQAVTAGGDPQTVNMYRAGETAAGEPIYRALVPAQTVPDNYKFLIAQFKELYDAIGADELIAGRAEKHGIEIPFMPTVEIKNGAFIMGSSEDEPGRYGDETQHRITLTNDFYMGRYEVTKAQFTAFLNAAGVTGVNFNESATLAVSDYGEQPLFTVTPDGWTPVWDEVSGKWVSQSDQTDDHHPDDVPMMLVSWYGAMAYAEWLGGRLPTEAEWEYACRAGTTTAYYFGDDAADLGDYAWYSGNISVGPDVVGTKRANPWGLYDMHGNVNEWCSDWYGNLYYSRSPSVDPPGPTSGDFRVMRGGSFLSNAPFCRSAYRENNKPDYRFFGLGFRVVFDHGVQTP